MRDVPRLTVLTTRGIPAVKTITRREDGTLHIEGYGRAKHFTAREIETDDKGRWLRRLATERESFVVLGRPKDWKEGEVKRRLSTERDGDEPTLEDVPREWMPVDVDRLDFEPMAELDDGDTLALEVLARLGIRGTRCLWHLTNSHGVNGKHRVRLWVRLAKPATCEMMREWAKLRWGGERVEVDGKSKRIVDTSVLRPAQPIYTGDPVWRNSVEAAIDDPVERRVGAIDGEDLELRLPKGSRRKRGEAPDDENLAALEEAGLYIRQLRPGQHSIVCPWEDEHTGEERDDDTFYFEPYHNGHDIPAFKCHHEGCAERHWSDVVEKVGLRVGGSFTPVDDDRDESFVYVHRLKQFWDPRDGALIDRESYDSENGGKTRRGTPTDRFIASPKTQKVNSIEFLPGERRIIRRRGIKVLNTYIDMRVEPDPSADPGPWVEHLQWLVPGDEDRGHLMDWLAWAYQRPGDKITWAPILYSKAYGIGKTTVFNCLAECVGKQMVSEPTQAELEDRFNDWCFGKLLVKIEELMSGDKFHVAEKLKPVVANPTISVRRMHQTGFVAQNVANVCASTNHMQALPIETGDRRWMIIQCVEASVEERRPRMRAFHRWLEREGYAGIAAWLSERDVSRFQPRGEAPMTPLKELVIEASKTDLDRAIDLCEAFDREEVVTSSVMQEFLANNECEIATKRLGLIAAKRGWKTLPEGAGRVRTSGRRLTLWTPNGSKRALLRVANMGPSARDRWLSNLATRQLNSSDDADDDAENADGR